jgi:hypothetical protein
MGAPPQSAVIFLSVQKKAATSGPPFLLRLKEAGSITLANYAKEQACPAPPLWSTTAWASISTSLTGLKRRLSESSATKLA